MTTREGVPVLEWPLLDGHGVRAVVTTRGGGVSTGPYASLNLGLHVGDDPQAVHRNRSIAALAIGLGPDDVVVARQAHGRGVVQVGPADAGRGVLDESTAVPDADALVTRTPGLGLMVLMADCVPVVLVDPSTRAVACIHAGWRGTVADVVGAAVQVLVAGGSRPVDLLAGIGPAVPVDRYQVGPEVAEAVVEAFGPDADALIRPDGTGRWLLDLWAATRVALTRAGIPDEQIALAAVPTGPDGPFFSDRALRPCGRFGLLATLTD
jgi:polyphenol oxidase